MFRQIAAFEFRYQLRQPVFWVASFFFLLFNFALVASDNVSLGAGGNVKENAPFVIGLGTLAFSQFYMFITTAFVANVVVRDQTTGFGPIVRATPMTKFDYLFGRFTGAFLAAALAFWAIPLGQLVGVFMPWIDPETLGPVRLEHYLYAYLLALPNVLLTSAIFFAVTTLTRSMMASYVAVVVFLILNLVVTGALGQRPEMELPLAYGEPFGLGAFSLVTKYWTALERNTQFPLFEGVLLWNRLLVIGVSLLGLGLAYVLHRSSDRGAKVTRRQKLEKLAAQPQTAAAARRTAVVQPSFDRRAAFAQLAARTRLELGQVFRSPAYVILLLIGMIFSGANLWFGNTIYGSPTIPVTTSVINTLSGNFGLIAIIVAIYYAGELVWRERDRRTHEIIDASPVPDWAFVAPKTLAITLVLVSTLIVGVLTGVAYQAIKGHTDFQLGRYLLWYVLPQSIDYALLAALAVFLQALSPNKFVGWGLMVIYLISTLVLSNLGFEHNLYQYGDGPAVPLSDMNGQGDFWKGAYWFRAYWTAFALILLVLAYGLWRRGAETRLLPRLRRLPRRLRGPAGALLAGSLAAFAGLGVWIYVNTNVWNEYRTSNGNEAFLARYEQTLLPFEATPQPSITDVRLELDLDPHAPRLATRGQYMVENRTGAPLEAVHLRLQERDLRLTDISVEGARLERGWDEFSYWIYRFDTPMAPGERRAIRFETLLEQRGFRNSGNTTRLVDNGTFVNNSEFAPSIGMNRQGLLQDRADRRKHGLPAELRPARLEDESARSHNYVRADWVNADITVTTVAGQTPIAPGYRVSDVTNGGRRTARFVTEAPILHFFSIQSADYEVRREQHGEVELAVYYDRQHPWNVQRMIDALRAGLEYFETAFSPYQFRQARIVEFPGYASFAQAFANTMPYSESIGFVGDFRNPEHIDYVTYVTAHELGHQWWAHQVIGADMQGMTVLSETLAQYSALMTMERIYGRDQIRRFLKYELDRYLRSRGGEALEELPLIRVENQPYIHYQKGGLVMYLLRDLIGEEPVNRALRRVIGQYAFQGAPYPTSRDLVSALRAEAGAEHQDLITDLFERITLYDVKTTDVAVEQLRPGRWQVTLTIEARKLYADGQGAETEAPMEEMFDVGLFTAEPGRRNFDAEDVILFERRPIRSGRQTLTFIVDRAPTHAGVDPYNKRIDRNSDDNIAPA